jgi:hypothetical protein
MRRSLAGDPVRVVDAPDRGRRRDLIDAQPVLDCADWQVLAAPVFSVE